MEWKTVKKRLSELKPLENNPRKISNENLERLGRDIENLGNFKPLICDIDFTILGGNQKYKKLLEKYGAGYEVEVSVPEKPLTEKQRKEVVILDNKHRGEDDIDMLMKDYSDTLESLGFDDLIPEPEIEVKEDNYEEPEDLQTDIVLGDIFQLGNHRLMCGDSTKIEDVEKLMGGQKADMVFTDPPYGIDLDTDYSGMPFRWNDKEMYQNKFKKVEGDSKPFNAGVIFTLFPKVKELFLWGADYYTYSLPNSGADGTWYCWDKREDDEGESYDKMLGSPFELCWGKKKRGKKFIRMRWASFLHSDATNGESSSNRVHPTQKPIALSSWFITRFSEEGWNIVDIFGGSGGCLLACEQTNRKCYMMELDPHYCQVIIDRWEKLTNKKAKKL